MPKPAEWICIESEIDNRLQSWISGISGYINIYTKLWCSAATYIVIHVQLYPVQVNYYAQ